MEEIITFGCRLNFYESEVIKKRLTAVNYDLSETIIINSCAVTNEAERKVKQKIRKIHREQPHKKIVVVGCAVQLKPEEYSALPGVSKIIGNSDKLKADSYLGDSRVIVNNANNAEADPISNVSQVNDRSRGFVQIQNGCDHDCTFCAITVARGNNRSVSIEEIIKQITFLVANGYHEVVLTGVDITDYGKDLYGERSLYILLKRILSDVPLLNRLRLSSVDVAELKEDMIKIITTEKRLMPHIHISLQSGDNMILKRMKRRHSRENVIDFCKKVQSLREEVVFGADIIVGFPTETEEMFQNSLDIVKEAGITYLHVFPYSSKDGTKAAKMPQLARETIKDRAKKLIKLGDMQLQQFYSKERGKIYNIIVEQHNIGRAENFALVKINNSKNAAKNNLHKVAITGIEGVYLTGECQ